MSEGQKGKQGEKDHNWVESKDWTGRRHRVKAPGRACNIGSLPVGSLGGDLPPAIPSRRHLWVRVPSQAHLVPVVAVRRGQTEKIETREVEGVLVRPIETAIQTSTIEVRRSRESHANSRSIVVHKAKVLGHQ